MGQRQSKQPSPATAVHARATTTPTPTPGEDEQQGSALEAERRGRRRTTTRRAAEGAMDTFFLSHGAPTLSIDDTIAAQGFFKSWLPAAVAGAELPRAILVVSGHWEAAAPTVNVIRGNNDTIHDFYGFPKAMYKVRPSVRLLPSNRIPCFLIEKWPYNVERFRQNWTLVVRFFVRASSTLGILHFRK